MTLQSLPSETAPLLPQRLAAQHSVDDGTNEEIVSPVDTSIDGTDVMFLPLALILALAMAATAATSIFVYATLLCKDPTACTDPESNVYAGEVALVTAIANLCGLLAVGPLERFSKRSRRGGLCLWIVIRSMSVVSLALGVHFHSAVVALSGRVFQGLASDNVLHLSLNLVYVQTTDHRRASRLIGTSLVLYMLGISFSPFVASLFSRFEMSFAAALALFGLGLLYLVIFVKPTTSCQISEPDTAAAPLHEGTFNRARPRVMKTLTRVFAPMLSPLFTLQSHPLLLLIGLSLLTYNAVQSYVFTAILIHTAVAFHFSSQRNGMLMSLVHAVSAVYLLLVLYIVPGTSRLIRMLGQRIRVAHFRKPEKCAKQASRSRGGPTHASTVRATNSLLGILSFATQILALLLLTASKNPYHVYLVASLLALGLATPSFMKSFVVTYLPEPIAATRGFAALAFCETLGSLMAPLILGGMQARWPGVKAFLVGAGVVGVAGGFFLAAIGTGWWEGRTEMLKDGDRISE